MSTWWGDYEVAAGEARSWAIGRLTLWAANRGDEWHLAHHEVADGRDRMLLADPAPAEPEQEVVRCISPRGAPDLALRPAGADRPIVVRPSAPLRIAAGDEASIFVTTPAWVEVRSGAVPLLDVPTHRLSDTWFGPSTVEGELCYASVTEARLRREELPSRPGRVFTEIVVTNRDTEPLQVERVQIPLPHLPLFLAESGHLWTSSVTLVHRAAQPMAEVRVEAGPPAGIGPVKRIREPRQRGDLVVSIRALGAWLVSGG